MLNPPASMQSDPASRAKHLQPEQINMIDEALASLGDYGEIRLVVEKGQIRFLTVTRSFDALKWRPPRPQISGE